MTDHKVLTALVDNEFHYARTAAEVEGVVHEVVDTAHPSWASLLYLWDRPCRESWDGDIHEYPDHQLRVYTDPVHGWGALNFTRTTEGFVTGWDSRNPYPPSSAPTLWFDPATPTPFRHSAVLPLKQVRAAVREFTRTGERPTSVQWQQAEWL